MIRADVLYTRVSQIIILYIVNDWTQATSIGPGYDITEGFDFNFTREKVYKIPSFSENSPWK